MKTLEKSKHYNTVVKNGVSSFTGTNTTIIKIRGREVICNHCFSSVPLDENAGISASVAVSVNGLDQSQIIFINFHIYMKMTDYLYQDL